MLRASFDASFDLPPAATGPEFLVLDEDNLGAMRDAQAARTQSGRGRRKGSGS